MKRQILIVDDDATIRVLLETHFAARGFSCQVASDGGSALAILRGGQIQVVVTDLDMRDHTVALRSHPWAHDPLCRGDRLCHYFQPHCLYS
jgi:CheY-like chemotaxis protein